MIRKRSTISLLLGCVGAFSWLLPVLGILITIVGLSFGIRGYIDDLSRRAKVGIVLNILFLEVSIIWLTVIVVMRLRSQWFFY